MLISAIGDVGSGKTLLATYLASKDERPIYSNYKIKLPNYHDLKPEILSVINTSSLIIIDEAYTWLESRLSGRDINLYSSYILFQSRKRGLDIILTDQLDITIDVRYRMMTNFLVFCQQTERGFEYTFQKMSRLLSYRPKKKMMPFSVAEKIYPLYDSWELINPIDDNLLFKVSENKGDILKIIDKITAALLKQAPASEYTTGIIEDICLRNQYPKSYVKLIYNSIKASKLNIPKIK